VLSVCFECTEIFLPFPDATGNFLFLIPYKVGLNRNQFTGLSPESHYRYCGVRSGIGPLFEKQA
jgi:hypothetical protein